MATSNTDLIKIAQKHLGQGGTVFRKYCGLPSGAAWCNAFVDYIAHEGGVSSLYFNGRKETYCPNSIKWCKKNLAKVPLYWALPADIIYFDWEKNGVPNHIGLVRARKSTSEIYTIEGNTNGGKVAQKTRAGKYVQGVFRPHFPGKYTLGTIKTDGEFSYNSIANLQRALKIKVDAVLGLDTVRALQRKVNVKDDGEIGPETVRAIQSKLCGFKGKAIDGEMGPNTTRALQNWINKTNGPATTKPAAKPAETKPATKPAATKPATTKPKATLKSRKIEIDLTNQIATVYGVYSDGTIKPIMSEFISSAKKGKTTPTGSFKIQGASGGRKAKLRTAKMASGKSYAEFLCRFHGSKCMHTVPYKKRQKTGHVNKSEFNKLGTPVSSGCVRMPWILASYIYNSCPVGTPVKVFKGKSGVYPMGKPKKYKATTDIDPTYKK